MLVTACRFRLADLISGPGGAGTLLGHSHAETLQTAVRISTEKMEGSWLTLVAQSSSNVGLQKNRSKQKPAEINTLEDETKCGFR